MSEQSFCQKLFRVLRRLMAASIRSVSVRRRGRMVPIAAGLGVCFLSLAWSLPAAVPQTARAISLGIVQGAGYLATSAILVIFPIAICISLFRGWRSLVWQTS